MSLNEIENICKKIFIEQLNLEKDYFEKYSDNGNNLFIVADLGCDTIDRFEILEKIEHKCNILINDENDIWADDLTVGQYSEFIYNEILKNYMFKY